MRKFKTKSGKLTIISTPLWKICLTNDYHSYRQTYYADHIINRVAEKYVVG